MEEKDKINIYTEGTRNEFEIVEVDIHQLVFDVLKSKGFVKDNLGGKTIFVKNFTFVLIDERRFKVDIGGKEETRKTIHSIVVGTDINDHKLYGKGINVNPDRITDLILTLDYFNQMNK